MSRCTICGDGLHVPFFDDVEDVSHESCRDAVEYRLGCFAGNVRDAAALCAAFTLGGTWGMDPRFTTQRSWSPGCGRAAPGWEP